jgi:beta-lactamase regulating signal transducer with metallopeptidase domain
VNEILHRSESLFAWVLQTSWQAAVLAVVITLAQTIFRRRLSPAWRYGLWLLLLVRLVLPSSPRTPWSIYNLARVPEALERGAAQPQLDPTERASLEQRSVANVQPEAARARTTPEETNAAPTLPETHQPGFSRQPWFFSSWHRLGFAIWSLGVCAFGLRLVWSNVRFSMSVRGSATTDASTLHLLESSRELLRVRQRVIVIETNAVQSPSIHGLWQKQLLLPKGTFELLSKEELRCVFLHEVAHLKRRDLEVNWLASLLLILHWFNPVLWFAFSRMRNDRELACDALVLTKAGSGCAQSYGETIIKVVEGLLDRPSPPGVLALSEDQQRLKERIGMISRFRQRPRWSALALALSLGIAAAGLTSAGRNRATPEPAPNTPKPETSQDSGAARLARGIHGQVVDPDGNPVTNASVECEGFAWRTTTDTRGSFSWIGEDQPRMFKIRKSGYKTFYTGALAPGENATVFTMQHTPTIAGRIIDKQTGAPIANFQLYQVRILQGPVTPSLSPRGVVTGNSGAFKYSFADSFWPDSAFCIDAEGYLPILSRPLTRADDGNELTFEMTRSLPVKGKVVSPQGIAVEKAQIRVWCGELNMSDIPARHETQSDDQGVFTVPVILDGKVVVYHETGYAEVSWRDFTEQNTIQLSEWGHVKGHWPKPLPDNQSISIEPINWSGRQDDFTFPVPWRVSNSRVRGGGSFDFEEAVPPGEYMLTEWNGLKINYPGGGNSMALLMTRRTPVLVEAGRTAFVDVPAGRTVLGKIGVSDERSLTNIHLPIISLHLKQQEPDLKFPGVDWSLSDTQNFERWKQYRKQSLEYWLSNQGKAQRRAERVYEVPAEPDGTFRIDNVPPGTYVLQINAERWGGKSGREILKEISIPASVDGAPLDLGTLKAEQP